MASLAEMERELTIERTGAGLEVARQLGRKGGRKRQMTDSKIKSAKELLASGVPPRDVAATSVSLFRRCPVDSSLHNTLSVLYIVRFFDGTPTPQQDSSGAEVAPAHVSGERSSADA